MFILGKCYFELSHFSRRLALRCLGLSNGFLGCGDVLDIALRSLLALLDLLGVSTLQG